MKRFLITLLLVPSFALHAVEHRHALVMGVWNYSDPKFPPLPGIETDVMSMTAKLQELGFNVTVVNNPTLGQAKKAVDDFGAELLVAKGTGLFYFSGHGCENDGKNYLVPIGTSIHTRSDLDDEALSAQRVLTRMEESGASVNLIFLDCCRNPLTKGAGDLAPMKATGAFIGFATASARAAGASNSGSEYTHALVENMGTPGLSVMDMHTLVTKRVKELTQGDQVPFQYSGLDMPFALVPKGAAVEVMPSPASKVVSRASVSRNRPFVNSLGMKFLPVPGTKVLFCMHETRKGDYAAYASSQDGLDESWRNVRSKGVPVSEGDDHPVVNVSWEDAVSFCDWLSRKEGVTYRLPTDHEWSIAVGIGDLEHAASSPESKTAKIGVYPWGRTFPPRGGAGNYADVVAEAQGTGEVCIQGYTDGYATTSPVMRFSPNMHGLYDLGGNVWEWCEDWYNTRKEGRVLRGGAWFCGIPTSLLSSFRYRFPQAGRGDSGGFRVVLVAPGG